MPQLNEAQKEKRGRILEDMLDIFMGHKPWLTRDQAAAEFATYMEADPRRLGIINALAASCTPKEVAA